MFLIFAWSRFGGAPKEHMIIYLCIAGDYMILTMNMVDSHTPTGNPQQPWLPAAQPGPEAPGARQRGQRCHGAFGFQVLEGEHNGSLVKNGKSLVNSG